MDRITRNWQYYKFCGYGFLRNLRFFDAFFILFLVEKGLSFTQIGILYAVREIVINISEIPSGIIADTYGRKKALAGSFILYILSFLVYYLSSGFWLFMLAFVLYGIGDSFRSGTHKGMIMEYLRINRWEEQNINYYGHTRSWSQMGSAISSLLAGVIVFYSGTYRSIFLYSVIPYLINLVLILSYPRELDRAITRKSAQGSPGMKETIRSFFQIIRKPKVLKIINTTALHSAYLRAVKDYIQPLMIHVALLIPIMMQFKAEKKNGVIIGVIYFLIYLATSWASRRSARVAARNRKKISYITLVCGFLFGLICGVFYIYEVWIVALIAFVGIYVIENIRKPILTGFIADQVPNEVLTSVISAQSVLRTAMTALLALVFGILADRFGIGTSFLAVSLLLMLTTLFINAYERLYKSRRLAA